MRKIYLLPNLVTTANIFCGFYSLVASIQGKFVVAAWAVVFAGIFDIFDGRIARLTDSTSQFGIEYDSLSDLLSFGVAPAILMLQWILQPYGRMGWLAAFFFLACGALRLARFNSTAHDEKAGSDFRGLPIPGAAGLVVSYVIFFHEVEWWDKPPFFIILALTIGLPTLMVSNIPFPSFKEFHWGAKGSFRLLLIGVLTIILIAIRPEITLFLLGLSYLLGTIVWNVYRGLKFPVARSREKEITE